MKHESNGAAYQPELDALIAKVGDLVGTPAITIIRHGEFNHVDLSMHINIDGSHYEPEFTALINRVERVHGIKGVAINIRGKHIVVRWKND